MRIASSALFHSRRSLVLLAFAIPGIAGAQVPARSRAPRLDVVMSPVDRQVNLTTPTRDTTTLRPVFAPIARESAAGSRQMSSIAMAGSQSRVSGTLMGGALGGAAGAMAGFLIGEHNGSRLPRQGIESYGSELNGLAIGAAVGAVLGGIIGFVTAK